MTPEELLTTTRSVRQRLDLSRAVPRELLLECLEIAVQAPTGGNQQGWQWVIVTDPEKKRVIGERYRTAWYEYAAAAAANPAALPADDPRMGRVERMVRSAMFLADHMAEVPAMVIACIDGRADGLPASGVAALYGSIVPAVWSFMLAARLRGLGTAYTTLHIRAEEEIAGLLGIPYPRYTQAALLPVAYYTGDTFRPAQRLDLNTIVHWDAW